MWPLFRGQFLVALILQCSLYSKLAEAARAPNPIGKTIELVVNLETSIRKDGEVESAAYIEYKTWCENAAGGKMNEIKMASKDVNKLQANIQKEKSDKEAAAARIDELSKQLSKSEADLKAATDIRTEEAKVFKESETKLMESIDMLGKAIDLLAKKTSGSASFMQALRATSPVASSGLEGVLTGLAAVIDAAGLPTQDTQMLAALLQSRQEAEDGDGELGALDAEAHKSQSGGIIEVMEDLRDKAEAQLREARTAEANAQGNYNVLKASLTEQMKNAEGEKASAMADKDSSSQDMATAEGDLSMSQKELEQGEEALALIQKGCMEKAADHEESVKGRDAEIALLVKAKDILQSTTSGASASTYSFLQVSSKARARSTAASASRFKIAGREAVALVRRVSKEQRSAALTQLASRLSAALRYGAAGGQDPIGNVKGLITDMISRLESEASAEETEQKYCKTEMKKTTDRQDELKDETEGLQGKVDQAAAQSASLKAQVKEIQGELVTIAKLQAERSSARMDANKAYLSATATLKQGLDGVRSAMRLLRDYYAADAEGSGEAALLQDADNLGAEMRQPAAPKKFAKATSASASIIGLLEVVESDLAKNLAEEETEEAQAVANFERMNQENAKIRAQKQKDVEYKSKEAKWLDKAITEFTSDYDTASEELSAVEEYLKKLEERCIAKPEPFAARQARIKAEIKGLQEALALLEGEGGTTFLQRGRLER